MYRKKVPLSGLLPQSCSQNETRESTTTKITRKSLSSISQMASKLTQEDDQENIPPSLPKRRRISKDAEPLVPLSKKSKLDEATGIGKPGNVSTESVKPSFFEEILAKYDFRVEYGDGTHLITNLSEYVDIHNINLIC